MKSFKSLGVCDELIQALQKQGIKEPTPIQEQSIPVVFKGNDVIYNVYILMFIKNKCLSLRLHEN